MDTTNPEENHILEQEDVDVIDPNVDKVCAILKMFKEVFYLEFDIDLLSSGIIIIIIIHDNVKILDNSKRYITCRVKRSSGKGGSSMEAGYGPICFDINYESIKSAFNDALLQLQTGKKVDVYESEEEDVDESEEEDVDESKECAAYEEQA